MDLQNEEAEKIFETLNTIDVNEKVEKKNNLSYLSWAWAWAEVKKRYPLATYTIYEREQGELKGINYFTDGKTAWVKTGVTIHGLEYIEELPIMNFSNKSIPLENITSFDVNKAIQRSLTKALARHGLGLYIYAGEDLPDSPNNENKPETKGEEIPRISKEQVKILRKTIEKYQVTDEQVQEILNKLNYKKLEDILISDFATVGNALSKTN